MPPLGAPARAEQLATLPRVSSTSWPPRRLGALLDELQTLEETHEPESFEASVVRVARRDYREGAPRPERATGGAGARGSLG